jgi:peptidoglycan/LPS O-acetylase OafA/YrhL
LTLSVIALLLTLIIRAQWFRDTLRYTIQGVALISLFYSVLFVPRWSFLKRALEMAVPVWIGKLSYSLYLWHFAVLYVVGAMVQSNEIRVGISVILTILISVASYFLLEKPLQKLRARYRTDRHSEPVIRKSIPRK